MIPLLRGLDVETKKLLATGGVTNPMAKLIVMMIPTKIRKTLTMRRRMILLPKTSKR
ncbi:MAG: hypothetical protein NT061_02930 [Spirochaetes bacterium]|nr:hypothetical protein [Spirochaetota bacterium]